MKVESRRALMPADLRARDHWSSGVRVIGVLDTRRARAARVWRRFLAAFMFLFGFVFAYAALLLARSADPFTALVPAGVAFLLGWCAYEIWPRAREDGSAGGRAVGRRGVRTREASARRVDVK